MKSTKAEAKYRNQSLGAKQCAGCKHYIDGGGCKLVEGLISPKGVCNYYKSKGP